eukprot:TRINITY_DN3854_c0_g2_i1.p1 TRINITY_DN3854_c0_g2~~TRINITY_DN3854_c0_g2_i1.p1  ORF type:complete len:126 (+),score=38.84 TRINITY_DN3854_c0_g2_i1:196-573(+)
MKKKLKEECENFWLAFLTCHSCMPLKILFPDFEPSSDWKERRMRMKEKAALPLVSAISHEQGKGGGGFVDEDDGGWVRVDDKDVLPIGEKGFEEAEKLLGHSILEGKAIQKTEIEENDEWGEFTT